MERKGFEQALTVCFPYFSIYSTVADHLVQVCKNTNAPADFLSQVDIWEEEGADDWDDTLGRAKTARQRLRSGVENMDEDASLFGDEDMRAELGRVWAKVREVAG